jgi:hypothetical protein
VRRISEAIEVAAPIARVWEAVHVDIASVPTWSASLARAEVVGGGRLRPGSRLRYTVRLPAGRTVDLNLVVTEYEEFSRCAGTLAGGPLQGTWSWVYTRRGGGTHVVYTTEVAVGGVLRFAGGLVEDQVLRDVRRDLRALKRYCESGAHLTTSAR